MERDKSAAHELLGALDYLEGKRYADFNASTDRVAEYGLAALVGGIAAFRVLGTIAGYMMHPYRPRLSLAAWRRLAGYSFWSWSISTAVMLRRALDAAGKARIGDLLRGGGANRRFAGRRLVALADQLLIARPANDAFGIDHAHALDVRLMAGCGDEGGDPSGPCVPENA